MANINPQAITMHWDPVVPECQHVTYSITSSNCGNCLSTTSTTSVTCFGFNVSTNATICTLDVKTIVCADITGEETSIHLTLKGISLRNKVQS